MSTTTVQVPINTMLADLDESLKTLLKRELDRHGFDGVEIVFDAPDKEWAASLSSPAVNLFLYDIREAKEFRPIDWEQRPGPRDGRLIDLRPPLRDRRLLRGHRLDARRAGRAPPALADDGRPLRLSDAAARRPHHLARRTAHSAIR